MDNVGGAGTADKVEGKLHETVGKVKQVAGIATDNDELKHEGQAEEAKGNAQQVIGHVEEALKDIGDAIVDGVKKVGGAINDAMHKHDHPESHKES